MTRSLTLVVLTFASLAPLASTASAGCGGGGGRSSGRLAIAYHRNVPHMRSHAPRHVTPSYHRAAYRAPVYTPPQHPVVPPQFVGQPLPAPAPFPGQPQIAPAPQPILGQQPAAPAIAPQPTPQQTATQAALEALGGVSGAATPSLPQFAPAPQPAAASPNHVGAWTANVGGQATVSLRLDAGGSFVWTANAGGKVSTFQGRYTMAGGQLTLVRSDSQQLAGAWTIDATGGFRFQLAGAQDGGLLFVRG